jgi:hypothetical protein
MGTLTDKKQAEAVVRGLAWRDWDYGTFEIFVGNVATDRMMWRARFKGAQYGEFEHFEPGQEDIIKRRLARRAAYCLRMLNADE